MTKNEYLNELRDYLVSYNVDPYFINENIDYYSIYIDNEVSAGKDVDSVIGELGSPTVLGKTIVDRAVREGRVTRDPHTVKVSDGDLEGADSSFTEENDGSFTEDSGSYYDRRDTGNTGGITPGKLKFYLIVGSILAILILVLVIGLIANLFRLFFPVIIVGVIALAIMILISGGR